MRMELVSNGVGGRDVSFSFYVCWSRLLSCFDFCYYDA